MKDIVNSLDGYSAIGEVSYVTSMEKELAPLRGGDGTPDVIKIALVACAKIIQSNDALIVTQKFLKKVGADKTSYPGYKPRFGVSL